MSQELSLRQKAIRWKQAGRAVSWICQRLERSRDWFYKWWNRYQEAGASGLRDRTHAPKSNPQRWSGEIRQVILDIRDRLMRRRGPRERYRLAGAATIRHELACLGYDPLPSLRTIERVLQQGERTSPAFHPEPCTSSSSYPMLRVTHSNQRHQVDLIGPRYLKGSRRQWFFLVYRDAYDGAVFVEFQPKPHMEEVLAFVVRAWQRLGLPDILQVDNSDLFGLTSHPGSLNRFSDIAGRGQPYLYPRARTLAQWRHRTLQRLAPGTHSVHPLAFSLSGSTRTEGDDGHLFSRTHSSRSEFSDHRPDSKTPVATYFASQLPSTSGTSARCHRSRDLPSTRSSLGSHYDPGREIPSWQTFGPSVCLCHPFHSNNAPQNLFAWPPDQTVRFPVHWQTQTVSTHLAVIFSEVSSALTWRTAICR
jgi:transposase-like protein